MLRRFWLSSLLLLLAYGCGSLGSPTGLAASSASSTSIRLTWVDNNQSPPEDGFIVERSLTSTSGFAVVATKGRNTTSFVDGGLVTGRLYYYRVRAVRGQQTSSYSNVASAAPQGNTTTTVALTTTTSTTTVVDGMAPSVPAGFAATAASCSQINLAWAASSDNGSGVGRYRVYRNSVFLKQVVVPATTTSDTGLAASTVYGYQVSAVDNAGNESARSATASTNTVACATGGAHLWSRQMGGTAFADAVAPAAVAVDGSGNVVMTGVLYGTVKFGTVTETSAGRGDMVVVKYSAAGAVQWVRRFGGASDEFGTAVATDTSGNVYVTGYYFGTVGFGGGALTSAGYDVVLAKYTASGAHVWSKSIGGASYDQGQAIAVDGSGNVLVAGQFAGSTDFGGGTLTSAGSYDGFVAKYTTSGTHVWSRRMGGASLDMVTALGIDGLGNPTVVGYFSGTSNFGGANLTSAGSNDVFVVRHTAAGAHQWSSRFGDVDDQRAYAAAVDGAGNVVLTGAFYGTVGFGGPLLPNTGGGGDIFLAKLTASGAHVWSKAFGTALSYGEVGEGVAVDSAGNVVLTGEIIRDVDFGGGRLVAPTVTYDPFVAKFSPAGVHQWSKRFAADWDDHGTAVAVDGSGNVVVSGDFYQAVNFGGGLLSSPGGVDGFLVKFGP